MKFKPEDFDTDCNEYMVSFSKAAAIANEKLQEFKADIINDLAKARQQLSEDYNSGQQDLGTLEWRLKNE